MIKIWTLIVTLLIALTITVSPVHANDSGTDAIILLPNESITASALHVDVLHFVLSDCTTKLSNVTITFYVDGIDDSITKQTDSEGHVSLVGQPRGKSLTGQFEIDDTNVFFGITIPNRRVSWWGINFKNCTYTYFPLIDTSAIDDELVVTGDVL